MILTLQKLLQKSKQVSDPRDAHALALDLVESMLRHYAVVAIAAYRHAGARDAKVNRILSEQLPRPSMGSWKNFLQVLAATDKELFPVQFREKFLGPLTRKVSNPDISAAYAGLRKLADQDVFAAPESPVPPETTPCTPLEFFDAVVAYRNRFAGHGTHELPESALLFAPSFLKGTAALCVHLHALWHTFPVYVSTQSRLSGRKFFRLAPLVEGMDEIQAAVPDLEEDRLYLCFGDKNHHELESLYPVALWHEEDILFANGTKDLRTINYLGYINQKSFETDIYGDDFQAFLQPFSTQEKTTSVESTSSLTSKPQPSIVVLPFVNMSSDPEQEYFCDGMAEEIINALTHVEALHVVARTSAFSFKGKDVEISEIGRKLKVAHVLEGSVRKAGNRLRITAQLITVEDGYHLWSERFDRTMEDVFAIQDEISLAVVSELKVRLLKAEETAMVKRHTVDTEAYELYLKGLYYFNRRIEGGPKRGIEYFQQAIEKDPHFALAYAGIAICYGVIGGYGYMAPREAWGKAKLAVEKALELDDMLAEAHFSLGAYKYGYEWDFLGAEKEFQRAFELNPNYALAHNWYSSTLCIMEKFDESIAESLRAKQLDPQSVYQNAITGLMYTFARRYNEAMEHYQRALEMDPYFPSTYWYQGVHFIGIKNWEQAISTLETYMTLSTGSPFSVGHLGYAYGVAGQKDKALRLLDQLDKLSKECFVSPYYIAMVFIGLGEKDQAFAYLEKAYVEREYLLLFLKGNPIFDSLRDDPRFTALLNKIGLPE